MSDEELITEARTWTGEPKPARGDMVPAQVFVDLVGRLADALEGAHAVPTEIDRLQAAYDEMRSAGEWHRRRNRRKRAEGNRNAAEKGWEAGFRAGNEYAVADWFYPLPTNPYRAFPSLREGE